MTFCSEFCTNKQTWTKPDKFTLWNTNKVDGWTQYKELTEDNSLFSKVYYNKTTEKEISSDDMTTTDAVEKMNKIMTKVKFAAFGIVKRNPAHDGKKVDAILNDGNDSPAEVNQKLLEHQRKDAEEILKNLVEKPLPFSKL